jgi:hypothetical protein
MDRVIVYGLTENFIEKMVQSLDEEFLGKDKDLSRLAFVFGGKRPALFLKRELAKKIKHGFFSPSFFSMDEFVEYTLLKKESFSRIPDLEACHLIFELVCKHAAVLVQARESFSKFLPWAREILAFIEQLDLEDVLPAALKNIERNAEIGFDVPENINQLLEHVSSVRSAFHKVLEEKKNYTRGLAYFLASRAIGAIGFPEFDQIFFCNLFYLHKTETALVKDIYDRKAGTLIFHGDSRDWSVLKSISKELGCPIHVARPQEPGYSLTVQSGFDVHSEVGLVREALKKINNLEETVVVLPEAGVIVPLLSEIAGFSGDFNVSMGYPLKRSALHALFENLFRAQETRKEKMYYAKDYLEVLKHPFIKNLDLCSSASVTRILVHKIEEVLLGVVESSLSGSLFISLSDIEEADEICAYAEQMLGGVSPSVCRRELKELICVLHRVCFSAWEDVATLADFAKGAQGLLELLLKKSLLAKYPLNLKMAEKIVAILKEFRSVSFAKEEFAQEDIFKIFKNKLDQEMVSFSGSPLKGLQLLGLFETRALCFKNVIVMDANESLLPRLKVYEPLIPREVMVGLGINRLEKEEEIQRYQFMRLISSAQNVHLVYQQGKDKERSRFIEELIWEKQKKEKRLDVLTVPRAVFQVKVLSAPIAVAKEPAHLAFLKDYGFSATSVNTYLHCPLRFYFKYILGLEEKQDFLDEPEAADVGTFVHDLLEKTFSVFVGKKPVLDAFFKKNFFQTLNQKFDETLAKKMRSDAFLLKEILEFRLGNFLSVEEKRSIKEIVCVERELSEEMILDGRTIKFRGRIDRIDRLLNDSLLVLDYKTGASEVMPGSADNIEKHGFSREALKTTIRSFQLPLYVYFVAKHEKGASLNAGFYFLKNFQNEMGIELLFKEREDPDERERRMKVISKALEVVLAEIFSLDVSFHADLEDSRYCSHCPFFYLCR